MENKSLLLTQIKKKRLHHAYLFVGMYVDKMSTVEWLIKELGLSQADVINVTGDSVITIEQIRNLQKKLSLAPHSSEYILTVIWPAEKLTIEAQNALLKILEEPSGKAIIILLADNEDSILPTVKSRCQKILFKRMADHKLDGNGLRYELLTGKWTLKERFDYAEELAKKKDVINIMDDWLISLRNMLLAEPDSKYYIKIIDEVSRAKKKLQTNANNRIILENLLLKFLD